MNLLFALIALTTTLQTSTPVEARAIAFTTQDTNGVHFVTLVSSPSLTEAVVRTISNTSRGEPVPVAYPVDRFDDVWNKINSVEFERYSVAAEGSVDQAHNYVFMVDFPEAPRGYRIPKCGIDRDALVFVEMAIEGLLPEGSPGLFEQCQSHK